MARDWTKLKDKALLDTCGDSAAMDAETLSERTKAQAEYVKRFGFVFKPLP